MVRFLATGNTSANPMISGGNIIDVPSRHSCTDFVTVTGLVNRPGTFAAIDGDKVADYLEYAGGVRGSLGETDILISNPTSEKSRILSGLRSADLEIEPGPGDNITVMWNENRSTRGSVMIFGAVGRPGRYPLPDTSYKVSDLLQDCRGIAEDGCAEMMQIHRVRYENLWSVASVLSYNDMESGNFPDSSKMYFGNGNRVAVSSSPRRPIDPDRFELEDGDSIYVPSATGMISVIGAVSSPGLVSFEKGRTVSYYIEKAGGPNFDADRDRMIIVNPETGSRFDAAGEEELYDGEIIIVPRKENNARP
jgi:protein involved in polysaccharide export with SLBB domain